MLAGVSGVDQQLGGEGVESDLSDSWGGVTGGAFETGSAGGVLAFDSAADNQLVEDLMWSHALAHFGGEYVPRIAQIGDRFGHMAIVVSGTQTHTQTHFAHTQTQAHHVHKNADTLAAHPLARYRNVLTDELWKGTLTWLGWLGSTPRCGNSCRSSGRCNPKRRKTSHIQIALQPSLLSVGS